MEKSLYRWFLHMRDKKISVSGLMLKEKAKELHLKIKENSMEFNVSDGWLQNFKKRYGVPLPQISGEKLSSQPLLVDPFKMALKAKIEELGLSNDQLTTPTNLDYFGGFCRKRCTYHQTKNQPQVQRWKSKE